MLNRYAVYVFAMDDAKNKTKAIELAVATIEKEYGKGSIMRLKEGASLTEGLQVLSTGSIGLDIALGIGGYPRGRIVEIYGPESSGKTTLTLHAIAQVQKAGGVAAFWLSRGYQAAGRSSEARVARARARELLSHSQLPAETALL